MITEKAQSSKGRVTAASHPDVAQGPRTSHGFVMPNPFSSEMARAETQDEISFFAEIFYQMNEKQLNCCVSAGRVAFHVMLAGRGSDLQRTGAQPVIVCENSLVQE